jgi:DNA repair photolyase
MGDSTRPRTGTKEWSDHSFNIAVGCSHQCAYCYARATALRFKRVESAEDWGNETLKVPTGADRRKYSGVVMFPTAHDITPGLAEPATAVLRNLLDAGNRVLVVSKPHFGVIDSLTVKLADRAEQVAFRFSIGTLDDSIRRIWEPGAPSVEERLYSMATAVGRGFVTGVSMEPYLNPDHIVEEFRRMKDLANWTIWIGKMNHVRQRVGNRVPESEILRIEQGQSDDRVREMYAQLRAEPRVRWKDSIRAVVGVWGSPVGTW